MPVAINCVCPVALCIGIYPANPPPKLSAVTDALTLILDVFVNTGPPAFVPLLNSIWPIVPVAANAVIPGAD